MHFFILFFVRIHNEPLVAIGDFPCGMENQPYALSEHFEVDFIYRVCRGMVIGMEATEVENDRDTVFCKIILI